MSRYVVTYMDHEGQHHVVGEWMATSAEEAVKRMLLRALYSVYAWPIRAAPLTGC